MSAFYDSIAAAAASIRALAGDPVLYVAAAGVRIQTTAAKGKTVFHAEPYADSVQSMQRFEAWDFLFAVSDLAALPNGTPKAGDMIVQGVLQYEVSSLNGEPCYKISDAGRTQIRVHTKLIAGGP